MKRVRLTIHPGESRLPETFDAVTGADEPFVTVEVVNWNVIDDPAAFLLRVAGDLERFERLLRADDAIEEYELLPVGGDACYCFLAGEGPADARVLWETFKRGSLLTIPPARWNADGSYTFALVGRDADLQAAIDDVPAGVRVEVDAVGGSRVAPDSVVGRLSDRQRDALEAAADLGYYASPRAATTAAVAGRLDCAPLTAAEHLRKAEATLVRALLEG